MPVPSKRGRGQRVRFDEVATIGDVVARVGIRFHRIHPGADLLDPLGLEQGIALGACGHGGDLQIELVYEKDENTASAWNTA